MSKREYTDVYIIKKRFVLDNGRQFKRCENKNTSRIDKVVIHHH